jgi:hypothetical protein
MLIFHKFAKIENAQAFCRQAAYGRKTEIHLTQESADESHLFPFELVPIIVLVERFSVWDQEHGVGSDEERMLQEAVKSYGGDFAGT